MSKIVEHIKRNSMLLFKQKKLEKTKISMVTCYDATFGKLIDRTKIDVVLVGDSLGNVILGLDDTTGVTIDHMVLFTQAVSRSLTKPLLIADMPFLTYYNRDLALKNAGRLIQEGRAQGVKMEGGREICPQVRALVENGIPVVGHLGLTPQHLHKLGGHRVQGKNVAEREKILSDARALEEAGASAIVLELIPEDLACEVTNQLHIPTIGIGAGPECDGQVLVLHDLLGFDDSFNPKFLKKYESLAEKIIQAVNNYHSEIQSQIFPNLLKLHSKKEFGELKQDVTNDDKARLL